MIGWQFRDFQADQNDDPFERLFKIFKDLLVHTSGDVSEALSWLTELDKHYKLTDKNYGIADFIKDLEEKGFISQQGKSNFKDIILLQKWSWHFGGKHLKIFLTN
jgi:Ca-activated chloride channel family protein